MGQFFLSHSSADAKPARQLRQDLIQHRLDTRIFLSSDHEAGPVGGTKWRSWIRNSMINSDLVLFIATEASTSPWCSAELGMAYVLERPVLAFHMGDQSEINPLVNEDQVEPLNQPIERIFLLIDNLVPTAVVTGLGSTIPLDFIPYPGLDPLTEEQAPLLHGRTTEAERIVRDFDPSPASKARVVTLTGPSGSGKSSLARAGVIPRLRSQDWEILGPHQPKDLAVQSAEDRLPALAGDGPAVLVVDQGEELVMLGDDLSKSVAAWLTNALEQGIWVMVAIRSEFRTEFGQLLQPKPIDHYVAFLGREALYDVIRGPAKIANLAVDEKLVDRLVGETGSGEALPLLALTLHELWKQRDALQNRLMESTLDQLDGVQGVMARLAREALHKAISDDTLALIDDGFDNGTVDGGLANGDTVNVLAPGRVGGTTTEVLALLTRLATPDRKPVTRSPIKVATLTELERRWLDHFVEAGLVAYRTSFALTDRLDVGTLPSGAHLADVNHEEIFNWQPLAEAIDAERERNMEREFIERTAAEWSAGGQTDDSLLLVGERLSFALANKLEESGPPLNDYVVASIRLDRERRIRRLGTVAMAVGTLIIAVLSVFLYQQGTEAREQRDLAEEATADALVAEAAARSAEEESRSIRIAAQSAATIETDRDFALLAAVAAHNTVPGLDSYAALYNALSRPEGPERYFLTGEGAEVDWSTARSLDGGRGLVLDSLGQPQAVDLDSGRRTPFGSDGGLEDMVLVEFELVPNTQRALFRGFHVNGGWAVGLWDFNNQSATIARYPTEIRTAVDLRDDRRRVAFGDVDGTVAIVDLNSGEVEQLDRHPGSITDIDVSTDGRWLAAASGGAVRLADISAPTPEWRDLHTVVPGERTAERVAFGRYTPGDGADHHLVAIGSDPVLRRWSILAEATVAASTFGSHPSGVTAIGASPDGSTLFTAGMEGRLLRWDMSTGAQIGTPYEGHDGQVLSVSATASDRLISTDSAGAIVWDLGASRSIERFGLAPPSWSDESVATVVEGPGPLAIATNTGKVITIDGNVYEAPTGVWRAWWAESSSLVFEQMNLGEIVGGVTLIAMVDGELRDLGRSLDAADVKGCLVAMTAGGVIEFESVGRCPDPPPIAVDIGDPIIELAWSETTNELVAGTVEGRVVVVDTSTGSVVDSYQSTQRTIITSLGWIGDEKIVVGHDIGGFTEVIQRTDGGDTIDPQLLAVHDDAVRWIVSSSAGDRLYLAGEDGAVVLLELTGTGGRELATVSASRRQVENDPNAVVRGLRLTADESVLASVQGSSLTLWELNVETLAAEACARAGRGLTDIERGVLGLSSDIAVCGPAGP